jgi:hypothetical protein
VAAQSLDAFREVGGEVLVRCRCCDCRLWRLLRRHMTHVLAHGPRLSYVCFMPCRFRGLFCVCVHAASFLCCILSLLYLLALALAL